MQEDPIFRARVQNTDVITYRTLTMLRPPHFFEILVVTESWVVLGVQSNFKALVQSTGNGACTVIIQNVVEPLSRTEFFVVPGKQN